MRYFVYKDSQILGPFAREELDQAGGLRPETLVCEEGAPGKRDLDWQALERVAELAGVATLPPSALGVLDTPLESASSVLERLELESLGVPSDESEPGWLRDLFDDAEFKERWGLTLKPAAGAEVPEEQRKVAEMSAQLKALQARIAELEAEQSRLLNKPAAASPAAPQTKLPPKTFGPAKGFQAPPAAQTPAPAPAADPFTAPAEDPFAAPAASEAPAADAPSGPAPRFALKPQEAPMGFEIRFGAKRSFKTAPKSSSPEAAPAFGAPDAAPAPAPTPAPAPAALPPMPSFAPPPAAAAPAPAPAPTLSSFPTAPSPGQVPPTVMPSLTPPPTAAALPPMPSLTPAPETAPPSTMRFTVQPPPAATTGGGVPPLEPPPIPTNLGGGPTMVPPAPATLMPGSGAAAAAAAVPVSPLPAPQTQDVLARLAKPAPAPETAPAKPRGPNKKLFIALGVAVVLLGGVLFFFLRSPRDLKTMANMGADQRPIGMPADDHQAQPPVFQQQQQQPQAAPQAFPPATQQAAPVAAPPAPQAAAPVAPPAEAGADDAAIALVKDYPLDGDRGTVAQWLQFQFQANPDDANQEQWTAGAVDATTYLVQYQLKPGPKSAIKESVNYVFEADVQRQTVLGKNPAARQLLAGGAPAKPKKAAKPKARKASKPKAKHKAPPPQPKEVPLAPLPSDAELLPPADNDSGFSNDTINPPL